MKPHGWRDLDPGVLAKLRKIAAIRENPYTLLRAQYVSLHNQYALQDGTLDDLIVPPTTEAEQFDSRIKSVIWVAHLSIALGSPKKLTARKKIARGAREFADTLQTLSPEDKEILLYFLPHQRQATFDDFITATRELADEARDICIAAGRRLRQQAHRFSFVNHLLSAVADGGRSLTLKGAAALPTAGTFRDALLFDPEKVSQGVGSKQQKKKSKDLPLEPTRSCAMSCMLRLSSAESGHGDTTQDRKGQTADAVPQQERSGRTLSRGDADGRPMANRRPLS